MGKFDSYFDPPEPPYGPCLCCGNEEWESCMCPECGVCGAHGDEKCYKDHGLVYQQWQLDGIKAMNERNAAAYEEDVRRAEEEQKLFEEYNEMVKKR